MIGIAKQSRSATIRWLDVALFLYFLVISGEMLNVNIGIFKPRVSHVFSLILVICIFKIRKMVCVDKYLFVPFLVLFISISVSSIFSADILRSIGYLLVFLFNLVFSYSFNF